MTTNMNLKGLWKVKSCHKCSNNHMSIIYQCVYAWVCGCVNSRQITLTKHLQNKSIMLVWSDKFKSQDHVPIHAKVPVRRWLTSIFFMLSPKSHVIVAEVSNIPALFKLLIISDYALFTRKLHIWSAQKSININIKCVM